MGKEQVLFSVDDDPESRLVFDAPKLKAQTTIGDSPVELSRNMSNKKTEAKISRDFGPFELTGKVGRQNKENTALLRAASDRAFIEASKDPYNRALSAGYSDGKFNANFQRSLPNDGGRPSNSLNLGYKTTFADGGPAQEVVEFQPTFSQQGIGSLPYQAPDTPEMEMSPQDYRQSPQYAPTQQYNAPAPMTAGLGSYLQGLEYKAPAPRPAPSPVTTATGNTTNPTIYDPVTQTYKPNPDYVAPVVDPRGASGGASGGGYDGSGAPGAPARDSFGGYGAFAGGDNDMGGGWGASSYDGGFGADGVAKGGRIRAYADGGSIPQGIASLGRGQDSMLVHMTPGEVQGLQRLAMAHGGSLTINPQTGLPEAGFLSSMLPMLIGAALAPATGGASLGLTEAWQTAALVGAGTGLLTGSLQKGLMAGLGAYGGASLGASLTGMGAEQAQRLAAEELAKSSVAPSTGNFAVDELLKQQATEQMAPRMLEANTSSLFPPTTPEQAAFGLGENSPIKTMEPFQSYNPFAPFETPVNSTPVEPPFDIGRSGYVRNLADSSGPLVPTQSEAVQKALARGPLGNAVEGFKQLGSKEGLKTLGGKLGYAGVAGLAAPLVSSAMNPSFNPPAKRPEQYYKTSYNPPKYNPETGMYDPASYGPGSYYTDPTQYAAKGGAVGYDEGGIARFYPLTGDQVSVGPAPGGLGGRGEKPRYSREINDPDSGAGINDNKAGEGPYKNEGGIHTNTPSGIKGLFAKTSAATLERYTKAKNAPMQAEAIAELRRRVADVNDYGGDTTSAAQGGLMGTYAAGGKLLRGPGDGMSDSIPAVIQGANPQRAALADGEFVIPADVVSHLGNGSTEAGSKRLYSMMDKVRRARTGNPKQGKQINPDRFMPA